MKPEHIKEQRKREVRKLCKRRREIWGEMRNLGYIELPKPIRHGWFKEILITHKVERYRNKKAILELYEKVEKLYWGKTKEDAQKNWDDHTSEYFIHKGLPTISKRQFNKLSLKAQALCTPFRYRTKQRKLKTRFYIRLPKGAYRIKFTRAYVTHSRRLDPDLISELNWIEKQLHRPGYFEIESAINAYKWDLKFYNYLEEKKQKRQLKDKLSQLKHYAAHQLINEEISWEIN